MTASDLSVGLPEAPPARRRARLDWRLLLLGAFGLLLLLSVTELITGDTTLASSGQMQAALRAAIPIGLAALGALWAERAGVVNIGLEGMMILGTWFGAWGALQFIDNAWLGVLVGMLGGALGGLLHALATVTFGVDQIVSGVAIILLGTGVTQFLSAAVFADMPGGGEIQSPPTPRMGNVPVGGATDWLLDLERENIFFVSDLAGVLYGLTTNMSQLTLLAIALVPLSWWVLWRTAFGLRLRSVGEHPVAAESLGVNVYFYKYVAVVVSGALAGLGGAFLALVLNNQYRDGQTAGRGFIGLAAMIFGNWRPGGLAAGAGLFGYMDAMQLRGGSVAVHALLLAFAIGLAVAAIWQFTRGRRAAAIAAGVAAIALYLLYRFTDTVPEQFLYFAPHITTLIVLALFSQRLRMPAADGRPYRRGEE
ncbi:MAG: ABC transporter permease [Sporichthyaceae bacterium]|nr:ABC transporter permease [Sporichthyaceae bacterium]